MKSQKPSSLEMQVLTVLWNKKSATAREVLESLPDGKERAYTTVLSVMQVMEKKGLLQHRAEGNRHVYSPRVKKSEVMGSFLQSMVSNLFGGKASVAMQHLLQNTDVSAEEVAEMRALLDEYATKKTASNGKKK